MGEEEKSFDASFVLTFVASDLDDADDKLEGLLETLHDLGFSPNGVATVEETIAIA